MKRSTIYSTRAHVLSSNYKTPKVSLTKLRVDVPAFPSLKFRKIRQAGGKYFVLVGRLKTDLKKTLKTALTSSIFSCLNLISCRVQCIVDVWKSSLKHIYDN